MTLCDLCGQNPAAIFFKAVVNNKSTKMNLCESCARQKGVFPHTEGGIPDLAKAGFALADIIGSLTAPGQEELTKSLKTAARPKETRCPECGTTYAAFRSSGFVGCSVCYEAFYPAMKEIIKNIHGAAVHTGLRPGLPAASSEPRQGRGVSAKTPAGPPSKESVKAELGRLRRELEAAVRREAYEQAAVLRDRIKQLEN